MITSTFEFRNAFIDIQNKAGFKEAISNLKKTLKKYMLQSNFSGQNESYFNAFVGSDKVIIAYKYNSKERMVVLYKKDANYASKYDQTKMDKEVSSLKRGQIFTFSDEESILTLSKLVRDLFIGKDFDVLEDEIELDENVLETYFPEDDFVTSLTEMHYIEDNLIKYHNLKDFTNKELQEIRNNVVKYYHKFHDSKHMNAMMSITAIIDNIKYNH